MKYILTIQALAFYAISMAQPTISFTFDDGRTSAQGGFSVYEWNEMILDALDKYDIKAAFFVRTRGMDSQEGQKILESWDKRGHILANHTHTHPNFNQDENTIEMFENELLQADSILDQYHNFHKLFRFPYLKEGNSIAKIDSIRLIMQKHGYRNGYVTIDNSEWYIDGVLNEVYKNNAKPDLEAFKRTYLDHLLERALYFENLSFELTNRHINHTILLHHNLISALFLDDLINMFLSEGWKVISAHEAFKDPVFEQLPEHPGSSLIWDLAEDTGDYGTERSDSIKYRMEKMGL